MKKLILAVLAIAGFVCASQAQTPRYSYTALALPLTTFGVTSSTNYVATTNAPIIDCRSQQNVGLQFNFALTASGSGNCVFGVQKSMDGINWDTTGNTNTFTVAANGTTAVTMVTNFNVSGLGFMRLNMISNNNAVPMTNISLGYGFKSVAP